MRRLVGATSASQSVVSGTALSGSLIAFTTYTILVTAKDSTGTDIGHGGDMFIAEIYNKWTLDTGNYWNTVAGAKQTISSAISAPMTDNGDGTYSYSFSLQLDGAVTVITKLLTQGGVNWAWYPNTSLSGTPILYNTTSEIYFYVSEGSFLPGGYRDFISGKLTSKYPTNFVQSYLYLITIYF